MRRYTLLAAGLLSIAGAFLQSGSVAGAGKADKGHEQLSQVRAEAERARARAASLDRQAREATLASERATIAAAALAARVQQAEAALAAADVELAAVREQRRALDRALARERAPVAQLLAGLQTQLRRPAALTLLQPGSIEDAVHLRAVLGAVGPQIRARTAALRASLQRARGLEQEAVRMAGLRRAAQSHLLARRTELATVAAAERLKARGAAGAANREAERAFAIGAQTRDLPTLFRRLDAVSRNRRGSRVGSAPAPYRLPVAGLPLVGANSSERSLEMPARPGSLVVAPAAGRVAFVGPYRGYGEIVILEHANGWTSLVTGLGQTQVAIGQMLVAGSPLGQAPDGDPVIGLELRKNGQRMNPLDQLR